MANFSLLAKLGLDTKAFQSGLKGAQGQAKGFASKMKGILAAATGVGFIGLAKRAIDTGSKISDLSEQLRINAEALQTLNAVAIKAGVDQGSLERALRNVSIRTQEALDGNKMYAESFERLGIDLATFTKLPTEKKLELIAKAYAKSGKSQEAFADIAQVLGQRAGPKMLEVLRRINDEGFENLIDGAKKSGQVMSNDVIQTMDEAADIIGRVTNAITVTTANILKQFEPAIRGLTDVLSKNSESIAKNIRRLVSFVVGFKAAKLIIPTVTGMIKLFTASTTVATGAVGRLIIGVKALTLSIKGLIASTGVGLAIVAITELASRFMFAKDKSQDLKTGMEDLPTRETAEKIDLVTESTRGLTGSLRETEGATRDLNFTMEDTLKILKMQEDFNKKMDKMEKERIKRKQEQFLREKELQALQLAASGDKEKAHQLKRQVELTRKAIEVAEKYKISLQEAAELVQRITEKEANRLNKIEEEKRQKEEEQRAIDEARSGEADKRGDFAKILEGERLREAANAAGEEFGVRFNKEISLGGEEMFRVIRDGFRKELLTEEQLQAGLERAIEKDPSNATLEKIATLLEGRLTNT
jgi:hypothetical protein